jgi:hypothetical protein
MHRHGCYRRYKRPPGQEKFPVQRFLCPLCGRTVSVLPANRLTYRPLEVERLQGAFDAQAGVSGGLDPRLSRSRLAACSEPGRAF